MHDVVFPCSRPLAVLACAASLALAGCYASGVKVPSEHLAQFQPGQTSCAEIVRTLGPATSQALTSTGEQQLTYAYVQANVDPKSYIPLAGAFIGSSHSEQTTVVFDCDRAGLLHHYAATQGQLTTGTGFLSGGKQ